MPRNVVEFGKMFTDNNDSLDVLVTYSKEYGHNYYFLNLSYIRSIMRDV